MITRSMNGLKEVETVSREELASLSPAQVLAIDQALAELERCGEVRIVKSEERICLIEIVDGRDILMGNG